jgi:hypothetical protein
MALSGDGGKGYGRRPQLAPNDQVENNWETIFGTKNPKPVDKKTLNVYNEEHPVPTTNKQNLKGKK